MQLVVLPDGKKIIRWPQSTLDSSLRTINIHRSFIDFDHGMHAAVFAGVTLTKRR